MSSDNFKYKIFNQSDLIGNLSEFGRSILKGSRKSIDSTKVIISANHDLSVVELMFKDGFDYMPIINLAETITKEEAIDMMDSQEWFQSLNEDS